MIAFFILLFASISFASTDPNLAGRNLNGQTEAMFVGDQQCGADCDKTMHDTATLRRLDQSLCDEPGIEQCERIQVSDAEEALGEN